MFKKLAAVLVICVLCMAFSACAKISDEVSTTAPGVDDAVYSDMTIPDYSMDNPVKYLDVDERGLKCNGWQDFGTKGEILTNAQNPGTTYVSQMYSYFIRNDLKHLYENSELPETIEELPVWLADTKADGRRSFWYSMGRLPEDITVEGTSVITSEDSSVSFIKAEYKVYVKDVHGERDEDWVIYFMDEEGVYSAYAVNANESFDFVKTHSESIVKSYQVKR